MAKFREGIYNFTIYAVRSFSYIRLLYGDVSVYYFATPETPKQFKNDIDKTQNWADLLTYSLRGLDASEESCRGSGYACGCDVTLWFLDADRPRSLASFVCALPPSRSPWDVYDNRDWCDVYEECLEPMTDNTKCRGLWKIPKSLLLLS